MDPLKHLRKNLFPLVVLFFGLKFPAGNAAAQVVPSLPGQFVYVENGSRLYLVRRNVEKQVLLVQAEVGFTVGNPRFSRDGRYLAYCVFSPTEEQFTRLFYLDTQTLEKTMITDEGSCSYDWWTDGKTLTFSPSLTPTQGMALDQGIWSFTLETGALEVFLRTQTPVTDLRWSPDGRTLSYFDYCFECVGQFHTYDLITGVTMDWSQEGTGRIVGPDVDWSPDGKSLTFDQALWMYAGAGETHGLELATGDAETWEEIYSDPGRGAYFPLWAPDGKRIAFASFEGFTIGTYFNRRADLMTVSPDGSNARKIYSSTYEIFPQAWSPDSRYMLIVEPLSVTQGPVQQQQLTLVDMKTGSSLWNISSFGALSADWAPLPAETETHPSQSITMAGQKGILFISPDHALAFYEPFSGKVQKLSDSFSGQEFSLSPDGKTILFNDTILSLQSQADGSVSTTAVETTLPGQFLNLSWSPDSRRFGYVEPDGSAWVVDLLGNRQQLADGNIPPQWSYDGQWMAYCDREGRLWIAQNGKPPDWIIQKQNCTIRWSPTQSILAYMTYPSAGQGSEADGTAFLYDPISGRTQEVAGAMSGLGWSPDGKLLSISRMTGLAASDYSYSITVVNPATGIELPLDEYSSETYANSTWIEQPDGYIFGRYRFQADLLTKVPVADILFDAAPDGKKYLTGSSTSEAIDIACLDVSMDITHPFMSVSLNDTPGSAMPGLHAAFSPDGEWILINDYVQDRTVNWLGKCDSSAPVQLSKNAFPYDQYFSPDSAWLVMDVTRPSREMIPQIIVQNLESGAIGEIQAASNTRSAWFQMPVALPSTVATATSPPGRLQPTKESGPIHLQNNPPLVNDRVTFFSMTLWAVALISIVLLMLSIWKQGRFFKKLDETPVKISTFEEKPFNPADHAAKLDPEDLRAAFQQGMGLVHAGNAEDGITELRKVIAAEPENDVAWFWLGIASVRQKDLRAAERCFLQAKKYGHPEAEKALAWLRKQKA